MELLPSTINILGTQIPLLKLLTSVAIVIIGFLIARLITSIIIGKIFGKYIPDNVEIVLKRIVFWSIIIIAVFSAAGNLGIELSGVLLAGSITGIIIGFATQSIVSNLISGLFLHLDRPIKIGDSIEVVGMDVSGVVTDITAFSTRIRRFDGVFVRIPNDKIFTSQLRNFSIYVARRVDVKIGIAYKSKIEYAKKIIEDILDKHPKILVEPSPTILVWELADGAIVLEVRAWVPSNEWLSVRAELLKIIKEELDKNGIEIP